ncbi:PEP-CTERM-box response regulator transcription factor [Sphingomonas bacterium]|uniref:PEP-CTERM-box response regulator transcription factor n=1 Tax=Sphingomonas bacterium TaxID=1895847 RepID=UPI00157540A8|nr:PEP-CTERM-box response regulator transcription factor [Sphingomonas bacterium]
MSRPVLLVVEDDPGLQRQLRWAYDGHQVVVAGDRAEALAAVAEHAPAVVTLDLGLPPDPDGTGEGFATLHAILAAAPGTKVIVASGHGARASALQAIADGAWDFYAKPIDIDQLGLIVARAFHVHALEAENRRLVAAAAPSGFGGMVYASPEMTAVTRTLERVAPADVSVLLLGASGTGKELLARGLHAASRRAGRPFVPLHCAAIPEPLLESELFGHEKGAFTGAVRTVEGKIEQAAGGTLFLDEIGDVPPAIQVKLLRFLQERVVERVGGRRPITVDCRVVAATHRDVDAMVADGRFREDLYYRLAEIVVRIPALAERTGDAALLVRHFVTRYATALNPRVTGLAPDARAAADAWRWPGNVRELENRVKRAVILAEGRRVTAADLDLAALPDAEPIKLRHVRETADRRAIARALARTDGNIAGASRLLGISRPTLYDLLKGYDLQA